MMVSAMRPTMRSVQPPKKPAATPASPPIRNTSATEATAMKKSSRVATTTRLNTSRPSWSVPNQCFTDGGFSAAAVSLASGSCGTMYGPEHGRQHDQHEQAEGEAGDLVLADDIAAVAERARQARSKAVA